MTGARVRNYEFRNPALEEGFCGIQRAELDEFHLESGSGLGHSGLAEHSTPFLYPRIPRPAAAWLLAAPCILSDL